jgi:hypothetical protein
MGQKDVAIFGSHGLILNLLLLIILSKVFEVVHMVLTNRIFAGICQL